MSNKRQIKAAPKMASATTMPIWKEKPTKGDEQKELERMFRAGEIDAKSTPDSVRRTNEAFMKFSPPVFGVHFRKTKAKFGFSAAIPGEVAGPSSVIPELGGGSSIQSFFAAENEPETEPERQHIEFSNAPFWTWSYTDHVKKLDSVCVALPIISGSRDIKFIISEDGMQLSVEYTWPLAMLKSENLFAEAKVNDVKITSSHPKWHAFLSNLLELGVTANSNPRGTITIDLPKQIKRESRTWQKEAIQHMGTQIILLEFSAYQKAVIIDDADTSIVFK